MSALQQWSFYRVGMGGSLSPTLTHILNSNSIFFTEISFVLTTVITHKYILIYNNEQFILKYTILL